MIFILTGQGAKKGSGKQFAGKINLCKKKTKLALKACEACLPVFLFYRYPHVLNKGNFLGVRFINSKKIPMSFMNGFSENRNRGYYRTELKILRNNSIVCFQESSSALASYASGNLNFFPFSVASGFVKL